MPWAKLTDERTQHVYKDLLTEIIKSVNGNINVKFKELLIRAEIQKRDFTKRQLNILSLIVTFSFNYGKDSALLKLTDFALCGIPPKKVTGEINKLIEMNIIEYHSDFNEFSICEPKFWTAPYHDHYDDKRSLELFLLNLKHAGYDVTPIVEKLNEKSLD
jgi:Bacteriophage replication protein O